MGNIYGVANPDYTPILVTNTIDVTLTAGSEVTILTTGAITAPFPGVYLPLIWLYANIAMGTTAPTSLTFAFKLGAGSDVDSQAVDLTDVTVSKSWQFALPLVGAASASAWIGSGSTINITANAATTAATFKYATSRALVQLVRVSD